MNKSKIWLKNINIYLFIAIVLLVNSTPQAYGQSRVQDETLLELEEVVVTARRRSENLQTVPIAISAFDTDTLRENLVNNLGDLQSHVPNLNLHVGDAGNAVIYIRGVGQIDSISFNDPGVGVYLDDVYLGRAQGSFLDVLDPQQIEVLRGPQGTFYGRNTIGGAVKFTSARPTSEFEGFADLNLGNFENREIKIGLSGPIVEDRLLGKIVAAYSQRDGYAHNLFDGKDDFDRDNIAWRGSLLFTPMDNLSIYVVVDGSDSDPSRSRTPNRETPIFSVVSNTFIAPGDDPFIVDVNYNDRESLKTHGVAATIEYDMANTTLKSITSYRDMEYRTHIDLDGTTDSTFGIYDFEDQDQVSQELQFLYQNDRISFTSGLYYFRETDLTFGGAVAPDFFVPIPGFGIFPFPVVNAGERDQKNTSKAIYMHLDYDLSDALGVSLGARYTNEKKEVISRGEEFFGTGITTAEQMREVFGTGVGMFPTGFEAENDWNSFSPKISVDYTLNHDTMIYAGVSRGFKSGGFNGRLTDRAQPFDPEKLWSYETGLKSTFLEQRVRLNVAAFYNDYKNFQLSRFSIDPDTGAFLSLFENAGKATIYGAELELVFLVNQQLIIDFNLGYLNSQYDELKGDFGIEVSDERDLVNAPKWNGRTTFKYEFSLGESGNLSIAAAVSARSKTHLTVSSSEVLAQDSYALFDTFVNYTSVGEKWTVILYGKNLTDKEYREHGFDLSASPGVQLGYYGTPRTYGVNVRYRF